MAGSSVLEIKWSCCGTGAQKLDISVVIFEELPKKVFRQSAKEMTSGHPKR
jgi:hypothetical protein